MAVQSFQWKIIPIEQFGEIAAQWQNLNIKTANTLLLSPNFISPLIKHFANGEMLIALALQNQTLVAAGIFSSHGFGQWQTFQPSQAPLGMWLCEPDIFKSKILFKKLAAALPGVVLTISVTQQDPRILARPEETHKLSTLDYITTARLIVPENFEEYWQSCSKNARTSVGKAKRRLEKEGTQVKFEIVSDRACIQQSVQEYGNLESSGWKKGMGTAIHIDNPQGKYYSEMLAEFAPEHCQIWRYFFDSELVATDLCIDDGKTIFILKTTYAEKWQRYSPAFCLHVDGIEHCSKSGLKTIEFYGPSMQWHKKLTQDERVMYHVTYYTSALIKQCKKLLG